MPSITPEMLEQMKARAREAAIRTAMLQRQPTSGAPLQESTAFQPQPQVVYVRRNLTVAELIVTVFLACGIVLGVQAGWNLGTKFLPKIEIKIK
jgi:aconitase B